MSITPNAAPSVILPNETGKIIDLKDLRPSPIILFFYPRDNTSGCTREAKDFTENLKHFNNAKNLKKIFKSSLKTKLKLHHLIK